MNTELLISAALAVSAVFLFVVVRPQKTNPWVKFSLFVGFSIFLVLTVAHFVANFFTNRGIDESVMYHLIYGLKGAGFSEYSALISLVLASLVITGGILYVIHKTGQQGTRKRWLLAPASLFLLFSVMVHPVVKSVAWHASKQRFSERFEDFYREPILSQDRIDEQRNLVFIYAEGLERTWLDEKLFPGVTPNLRKISESALDFSNIRQMPYTGWTMGGIVASQCGLPLVIPANGNSMSGTDLFLPGAICIGDLLKNHGYRSEFYGGAELDFAGKGNFFRTHGFSSVHGKNDLINLIARPVMSGWGLYDDDLLELAYLRFEILSATEKPFALFILTLDTHHPNGNPSKVCKSLGFDADWKNNPMHLAVRCSDHLIARFINKIRSSSYAEQTLIVLVSDHLAMKNSATSVLNKTDRKELFMVLPGWNTTSKKIDTEGSAFDIGATTLAYLGIETSIGFGRNLLREKTVFDGNLNMTALFRFWSETFYEFWEFPNLEKGIFAMPSEGVLKIGRNTIKIPVLVQFDKDLNTLLIFDFYADQEREQLDAAYRGLEIDTPFFYVADCGKFEHANGSQDTRETCMLMGRKGGQNNKLIHLKDLLHVNKEMFMQVIEEPGLLSF